MAADELSFDLSLPRLLHIYKSMALISPEAEESAAISGADVLLGTLTAKPTISKS